jgi:hypothetical protein
MKKQPGKFVSVVMGKDTNAIVGLDEEGKAWRWDGQNYGWTVGRPELRLDRAGTGGVHMTREEAAIVARILSGLTDEAVRMMAAPQSGRGSPDEHRAALAALFGAALDATRPSSRPEPPPLDRLRAGTRETLMAVLGAAQLAHAHTVGHDAEELVEFTRAVDRATAAISAV